MADWDGLENRYRVTYPGFESQSLRHRKKQGATVTLRLFFRQGRLGFRLAKPAGGAATGTHRVRPRAPEGRAEPERSGGNPSLSAIEKNRALLQNLNERKQQPLFFRQGRLGFRLASPGEASRWRSHFYEEALA